MVDGEKCICGSGRLFEFCCKPYLNKTFDEYIKELNNNRKINAYYIAVGMLSEYLIKVRAHTNIILNENPDMGSWLVQLDIQALDELTNRIYELVFDCKIKDDWGERFDSIRNLVDSTLWKEKCLYYHVL